MQLCTSTSRYPGKEGAHSSCLPPPLSSDTQHPLPAFHSYLYTLPKVVALTRRQLLPSLSCFTFFSLVLHSSPSFSLLSLPLFSLLLSPCPHILCLPMFSNKHVSRFISFHRQRCVCLAVCVCVCVAARGKGAPNFCSQICHAPAHTPWAVFTTIYPAVNSTQSRRQNMQLWQAKCAPLVCCNKRFKELFKH